MTTPTTLRGRAWVWPDNVNTDIIIPFRFKARTNDPVEMAKYAMYGFDPEFYNKEVAGLDFLVEFGVEPVHGIFRHLNRVVGAGLESERYDDVRVHVVGPDPGSAPDDRGRC